jgi:uncharacterized membrane protein YphA (DoxX/SURF4 family)
MKARKIGYWVATVVVAFQVCLAGGVAGLLHVKPQVEGLTALGYPAYVLTLIGAWKVLGGVALLAPRYPRLKEWAYAGIAFDLSGAAFSHASVGDPAGKVVVPLVLLAITFASWKLRPVDRTLAGEPTPAKAPPKAGAAILEAA